MIEWSGMMHTWAPKWSWGKMLHASVQWCDRTQQRVLCLLPRDLLLGTNPKWLRLRPKTAKMIHAAGTKLSVEYNFRCYQVVPGEWTTRLKPGTVRERCEWIWVEFKTNLEANLSDQRPARLFFKPPPVPFMSAPPSKTPPTPLPLLLPRQIPSRQPPPPEVAAPPPPPGATTDLSSPQLIWSSISAAPTWGHQILVEFENLRLSCCFDFHHFVYSLLISFTIAVLFENLTSLSVSSSSSFCWGIRKSWFLERRRLWRIRAWRLLCFGDWGN